MLRLGICDKRSEIDDGNTIGIVREGEIANNEEERLLMFFVGIWITANEKFLFAYF